MIVLNDDIGFSFSTGSAYQIHGAASYSDTKRFTVPPEKENATQRPWASWGKNNLLPLEMADDILNVGVLSAGLDAKSRIASGKGIMPFFLTGVDSEGKEVLETCFDLEILDWLELNDMYNYCYASTYDRLSYSLNISQIMLNRARTKINRIKCTDVVTGRLEKRDNYGNINNLYLCHDWRTHSTYNPDYHKKIPLLETGNELQDLIDRSSGYEFAIYDRQLRNGVSYYGDPFWRSTKDWIKIARKVPAMKLSMFENQMTIKYVVNIAAGYWKRIHPTWDTFTEEKKKGIIKDKMKEIDAFLCGVDNQYKSIISLSYIDPVTKEEQSDIKITVIDDKAKEGKGLPDGSAAVQEILFALSINPAFVGAAQPGATSTNAGGSNIRESYLTQIMQLEPERRMIQRVMNLVARFNGWSQRLNNDQRRLVFRHMSGILTTLDTGKSTKPEVL